MRPIVGLLASRFVDRTRGRGLRLGRHPSPSTAASVPSGSAPSSTPSPTPTPEPTVTPEPTESLTETFPGDSFSDPTTVDNVYYPLTPGRA